MVVQSSLDWDLKKGTSLLAFVGYVLPPEEYATIITNFPGTNCCEPFGLSGHFFFNFHFYNKGKKVAEIHTPYTTEKGYIEVKFDELFSLLGRDFEGIVIAEFYHSSSIPVELYLAHVHRKSGAYIAYPSAAFVGEELCPGAHTSELENSLFWPGLALDDHSSHSILVLNPYKVSYQYQLSLYVDNQVIARSKPVKVKPLQYREDRIEDVFSEHLDQIAQANGKASICITAQFKVLANILIRHRETGLITTIDHLHRYCLV